MDKIDKAKIEFVLKNVQRQVSFMSDTEIEKEIAKGKIKFRHYPWTEPPKEGSQELGKTITVTIDIQ